MLSRRSWGASRGRGLSSAIARGSRALFVYLREPGQLVRSVISRRLPLRELIDGYRYWLVGERGLAPLTVAGYEAPGCPVSLGWKDRIPQVVPRGDVKRFVASCERSSLDGARDRAIVVLLVRLGCGRSRSSSLSFRIWTGRLATLWCAARVGWEDRLPLLDDVGAALAEYLTTRGRCDFRRVFLSVFAPTRPIRPAVVGDVVQQACRHPTSRSLHNFLNQESRPLQDEFSRPGRTKPRLSPGK